jgi:CRISPR-associated protein Csb2
VFQALVAGASRRLHQPEVVSALRWLESLPPPLVAAPPHTNGEEVTVFVPNNDLDTKGADPSRIAELRVAKRVRPRLLGNGDPFVFVWPFDGASDQATVIRDLTRDLYQFGRGVDAAWATAEVLDGSVADAILDDWSGTVHWPAEGESTDGLPVPCRGTLDSLTQRHAAQGERFRRKGKETLFVQPPKPHVRLVRYDAPAATFVFALRPPDDPGRFMPFPLDRAHDLILSVRDAALDRLSALPQDAVRGVLVGRRPGEPEIVPQRSRVNLIPLASIGHADVDPAIRRILVVVPRGGPVRVDDLRWAFSGLEVGGAVLVEAHHDPMRGHYAGPSTRWRSVTPLALPAPRRRIEPTRQSAERKDAQEREREEHQARAAVVQALRHAGVRAHPTSISVSREPPLRRGSRAETFAAPPRFEKERLWHVELVLDRPVSGPLVLGDGRYLGLGVLAPAPREARTVALAVLDGWIEGSDLESLARALRRAVLARAQAEWGSEKLPSWVSGHEEDGSTAKGHEHLHFLVDPAERRLLIHAPRHSDPRMSAALAELRELRAGRSGLLRLAPAGVDPQDRLVRPSRVWRSVSPYRVQRHGTFGATDTLVADVRAACAAADYPAPTSIEVLEVWGRTGRGLEGRVQITFNVAVEGPLVLGRSRHLGGGLFEAR